MAHIAVSDQQALDGFLDKWRTRWPEWAVVEVFVPVPQREVAVAWFALLQELTDAAWAGADPRPGEAKLAWWSEELHGWAQGRRRHPLGVPLLRESAPWRALAASLPALLSSRGPASDWEHLNQSLEPFARSAGDAAASLLGGPMRATAGSVAGLAALQLIVSGEAAVPLRLRARLGDASAGDALVHAWAAELVERWTDTGDGARPERIMAALQRARLRRLAAGAAPSRPLPRLAALWSAWRAARD